MTASPSRRNLEAHLLLVAVTVVWGASFPLVKAALREVSPLLFNCLRMLLASAVLVAANWRSVRGLRPAQWRLVCAAGLFLATGYQLQNAGLVRTSSTRSAFLTGLVVVFVPLLSLVPWLRTPGTPRPRPVAYLGAAVAFSGIALLTSQPGSSLDLFSGLGAGEWLTLACALAFAVHLLLLARGADLVSARTLGTLQIVVAAAVMLLCLPLEPHRVFHLTPLVAFALLTTSVFATAAAFTIQSWAQQHLPASHTALILTLEPVFAWLVSLLFLGERLSPRAMGGAALILGGIVLSELGPTALSEAAILPVDP